MKYEFEVIINIGGSAMKIDVIFDKYSVKEELLIRYGFMKKDNQYIYEKQLENRDFWIRLIIAEPIFDIKVFEINGEEYFPFYIKKTTGSYVAKLKEEVDLVIKDILLNCFESMDIRNKLLMYVKDKYQTDPVYPWKKDLLSATLKNPISNKWYGLMMTIPYKYLKIEKEGKIDILNIKNTPEKIASLIDNIHYFPAYHMNKKYWFSVLLDNSIDLEEVKKLIDESYQIVANSSSKVRRK